MESCESRMSKPILTELEICRVISKAGNCGRDAIEMISCSKIGCSSDERTIVELAVKVCTEKVRKKSK